MGAVVQNRQGSGSRMATDQAAAAASALNAAVLMKCVRIRIVGIDGIKWEMAWARPVDPLAGQTQSSRTKPVPLERRLEREMDSVIVFSIAQTGRAAGPSRSTKNPINSRRRQPRMDAGWPHERCH
jgi:hypothetical protein